MVSTSVQDIENVRRGESDQYRSPEQVAGVKLSDRFRSLAAWTYELPDGKKSSRRLGLLLSGDKLLANAKYRDELLGKFERAIGGDMESWGLAQACRECNVEWIAAKGICDYGDEDKAYNKDERQQVAIRASVSLCVAVLTVRPRWMA